MFLGRVFNNSVGVNVVVVVVAVVVVAAVVVDDGVDVASN